MTDTKRKLIGLVSALEEESIVDYCYTFIGLKVYGKTRLPESITADLRQMWENHFNIPHEDEPEQDPEEQQAEKYRCNINRMLYDIKNPATLKFILSTIKSYLKNRGYSVK